MLVPIPEPLVRRATLLKDRRRKKTRHKAGLVEPLGEEAIEDRRGELCLVDPDRAEVGLVVEPARGVVVRGAVAGGDVERHVHRAGDLVEDLPLELAVARARVLRADLIDVPARRQRQERALLERDRVHRLDLGGVARGRCIGVQDAREAGGGFRRGKRRLREAAKLREETKHRRQIGNAPMLLRPVRREVVDHLRGGHRGVVGETAEGRTRVLPEDVVADGIAVLIELDSVDRGRRERAVGVAHAVGLDQREVELHFVVDGRVGREHRERLARVGAGHAEEPELLGQTDRRGPSRPGLFDGGTRFGRIADQLETRAGADHVVGDREDDPLGVGVVRELVPGPIAELAADLGGHRRVGTQAVGVGPVAAVRVVGDRRVVAAAHEERHRTPAGRRLRLREQSRKQPHQSPAPGGMTRENRRPRWRRETAARLAR